MPSKPDWPTPRKSREPRLPGLIILDGLSGAGKTTFLKRFLEENAYTPCFPSKDKGYHTTHFGRCPVEVGEDETVHDAQCRVAEWYMEIIEFLRGAPLIIDRWILSNIIYGHVYGNQVTVSSELVSVMLKRLHFWYPQDWRHLVFVAQPHVLKGRNIGRNREMFMEIESLKRTLVCFRGLAQNRIYQAALIDTSYTTPASTYSYIMQRLPYVPSN